MKGDDRGEIEREWAQGDGTRVGLEMHLPQMRLQVCFFSLFLSLFYCTNSFLLLLATYTEHR